MELFVYKVRLTTNWGYVHKQMMDFNQAEVMLVPKRIKKLGRRYRGEKKE